MRIAYLTLLCIVLSACNVSFRQEVMTSPYTLEETRTPQAIPTRDVMHATRTPWPTRSAVAPLEATHMQAITAIEDHTIHIYAQSAPAVVAIEAPFTHPSVDGVDMPSDMFISQGSGFIYDDQGHVVTNAHVVSASNSYRIRLDEQRVVSATVVGRNSDNDLALLQLDEYIDLAPLPLSNRVVQPGMWVMAIGNPFGLRNSVSVGIVSGVARELPNGYGVMHNIIQIDASVNPGSSGGVLLDSSGAVLGLVTAIQSGNGNFAGIGYAIPVDTIQAIIPTMIDTP